MEDLVQKEASDLGHWLSARRRATLELSAGTVLAGSWTH